MAPNVQGANPYLNLDLWANQNPTPHESEAVEMTMFMPNGILIILNISKTATLADLKEVIFFLFILNLF